MASRRWRPLGVQKPLFGRGDGDDRIEEAAGLGDDVGEALVVRLGEIALERRRLDLVDGEDGEDERVAAERVVVGADDRAAFAVDALR